jgi:DNA polymerase III epsilon subunit-like protein
MIALVLDTETTGLVENRTIKVERLPEIIEFYGALVDLGTGIIQEELDTLIKPTIPLKDKPDFGSKKTITEITGITNEMLANSPTFKVYAPKLKVFLESAPNIIAHNATFDQEMLAIEFARVNVPIKWPRVICSVEQTIHLKGKRLTLSDLHAHLFGEKFADAHRAKVDVQALIRCCVELAKREEAFI